MLNHDESLFEKINYLQDNVVASSHLVHNSIEELNRAIRAADTTLNNAINTFGQLNFTKFLENVRYTQKRALTDTSVYEFRLSKMFPMRKNKHQSNVISKLRRCLRWPSTRLVWTERRKRYNSLWSSPFSRLRANNVRGRVVTIMTILMSHASKRNLINARLQRSKKDT